MKIDQKEFTDWLMQQPDEREFNFLHGYPYDEVGCPMCEFLKFKGVKQFAVGGVSIDIGNRQMDLPDWFFHLELFLLPNNMTAKQVKQRLLAQHVE